MEEPQVNLGQARATVPLFDRYLIMEDGQVFSKMKPISGTIHNGYRRVNLTTPDGSQRFYVHKLVADLFLDKSSPKQCKVIHLDHDKLNNDMSNLKWVTTKGAMKHQLKGFPKFNKKSTGRPPKKKEAE